MLDRNITIIVIHYYCLEPYKRYNSEEGASCSIKLASKPAGRLHCHRDPTSPLTASETVKNHKIHGKSGHVYDSGPFFSERMTSLGCPSHLYSPLVRALVSSVVNTSLTCWCLGDIIALVTLLKQIGSGLKEHGGASDDYQNISQELKRNVTVFQELKSIRLPEPYSRHRERIADVADRLYRTTKGFQGDLSRYETRLGDNAPKGFHRGSIAKAKWAAHTSKKIPTYRAFINVQLHALQCSFHELLV